MDPNTNMTATTSTVDGGKQNNGKGLKIAIIVTSILAVCGIGFGVYGMMQSMKKDSQISDLKVQVKNSDGTTTTIEAPEIKTTTEDGTTVVITETAQTSFRNAVVTNSDEATLTELFESDNYYSNQRSISIYISNGEIAKCEILQPSSSSYGKTSVGECKINGITQKISQVAQIGNTQMTWPYIGFLLEDGSVEYIDAGELADNLATTSKGKLSFDSNKPVTNIVTPVGVSHSENSSGYQTSAFYHDDGSYTIFSDALLAQ